MIIATWLTHFILFVVYLGLLVLSLITIPFACDRISEWWHK